MRFATYVDHGNERFGLVTTGSDGEEWVYDPARVEALADGLLGLKGGGSRWYRPRFLDGGVWPASLTGLLALGEQGLDAARRMSDFLIRYHEQGDPGLLGQTGAPVASVELRAPIPRPRLLLGAVGNNAPFMRMDPARGRNLHQPSCHQRAQTSVVGPGQPIVVPAGSEACDATTELGIVIGQGGRDIDREAALHHVAGYTVVNDCQPSGYIQRWEDLDRRHGCTGFHFHASNTASWLGKTSDTMCAVGPYLVTKDEVGDPYDLLCYLRENGITRTRAHSGALVTGIEETIAWLSSFLTLEHGMIVHFGAMGRDGVRLDPSAHEQPDTWVETEIERVGRLRNPVVYLGRADWRAENDPARTIHASPLIRDLGAAGAAPGTGDFSVAETRHLWTLSGNSAASGTEPRPYPLAYLAPPTVLADSGATICLPRRARTVRIGVELGAVIGSATGLVSPERVAPGLRGYLPLLVLRDSSFADSLVAPHVLNANMPEIYERWPDGFTVAGQATTLTEARGRQMRVEVDGIGEATAVTDDYLLDLPAILAELTIGITLTPGDVISLGQVGPLVEIPASRPVGGVRIRASIEGLGDVTAVLDDRRDSALSGERRD